jgi:hypothetical protein
MRTGSPAPTSRTWSGLEGGRSSDSSGTSVSESPASRQLERAWQGTQAQNGTKYERPAAIVFREITSETTFHDLRLRGESGGRHQIDAVEEVAPEEAFISLAASTRVRGGLCRS